MATDITLQRAELLFGTDAMSAIMQKRVIVFGIGGVGSWCAECLVRSGIRHLTIVDADCVSPSNINRQLMATSMTVGQPKVEALRRRLLEIAPQAEITAIRTVYSETTADDFDFNEYDYVVDAIDSLSDKALLILRATASSARLVSSMGAALKMDPLKIDVAEFWKVQGCPLARALRNRFKRSGIYPSRKFKCVYSPELVSNLVAQPDEQEGSFRKAQINGSLMHITAIFGLTLASLILRDVGAETML